MKKSTDYKKWIGALIMFSFGVISFLRWKENGELFFMLLSLRDVIASYFLARREDAQIEGGKLISAIAYLSSGLPLLYFSAITDVGAIKFIADILAILGFLIVTWATIDLGTKLGVSPAKRGEKCTKGLYRYINHPMYLGYVIAHFGWVLLNQWNLILYVLCIILFWIRAKAENKIL